jgi:hypothetical protein
VNPVFVQAAGYQTSKFQKELESESEQATLFETERLGQFTEYDVLKGCQDEDQKILLKQFLFFKHEKELKRQAGEEKRRRRLAQKAK